MVVLLENDFTSIIFWDLYYRIIHFFIYMEYILLKQVNRFKFYIFPKIC